MFRQPQVRRWWAAMADRWRETVGTIAAVAMVAVAVWWVWPERNEGDATADEAGASQAAATRTLPPPRTSRTTTAAPEWPPWCGRYVALRVANGAYDDAFDAYAATYDPEYETAHAAYDEAWAKAESAYNAYRATVPESVEAVDATVIEEAEEAFDDWGRALDARITAGEALEALTSKAEAEHLAVAEAARAYIAASLVYADGYRDDYAAAVEAVRSYDAASAALDEAQAASDDARAAHDDAQAAYDDALDAYYAGNEDARFSRRFDGRGHHYDAYRAGWDAFHDAQASGNLFSDIELDPPALARYSAAVDAANGRWTDDLSSLARAAGERGKAWMSLDPAVEALNRAAVAALRSAVPDGVDWLDVKQTCEA